MADTHRIVDGRYELLHRLGHDGMGEVWTADDLRLHRTVAVKLLTKNGDPAAERMFVREAQAASTFNHPNVVTIYDAGGGAEGEPMYLVMERLHGQDLAHHCRENLPSIDQVVDWTRQICDALEAAQAANLVHRDLKPANLFLTHEGRIKILDFGLARTYATITASASAMIGTTPYMSPERWQGGVGDHRGDLYSLGCILCELLTGRTPFAHHEASGQMYAHLHEEPQAPIELRPDVSPHLNQLVLDLLAKNPKDRPTSATETRNRLPPHGDQRRPTTQSPKETAYVPSTTDTDLDDNPKRTHDSGDVGEAEELYRRALADGYEYAAFDLAWYLARLGRVEEAEELYRRAVAAGHRSAAYNLALLLEKLGRMEDAEELYRRALADGHHSAATDLANLLTKLNRIKGA
ncbi:tetratricopeptide repeat protein [Embleya sp. NPDC059237]|uniref:serine/threonine-protein kinase n=1 Tax=Embleya sp. NPDC059237 TaxID=3346784 RepID=UPI0036C5AC7D